MAVKKKPKSATKKATVKTKPSAKPKAKKQPAKNPLAKKKPAKKKVLKPQVISNPSDFESFAKTFIPYRPNKTEKYMNKSQKKHFISILNAWKEALDSEQEKTEQLIQQDQSNFPDSLDRAAKEEEFM